MEGRGTTNLLLAIIAGVLLFGKDAVVGGFQGFFIVGAVIGVIFLLLWGISAFVGSMAEMYRSDDHWLAKLWSTVGLVFMIVIIPLFAYTGLLWLDGVERPLDVAMDSTLGTVWGYVMFGAFGIIALAVASQGIQWLIANRGQLPSYGVAGVRWISVAAVAPYVFPAREWHFRTEQGSNLSVRVLSTGYVAVVATLVWSLVLLILFALIMAVLDWTG